MSARNRSSPNLFWQVLCSAYSNIPYTDPLYILDRKSLVRYIEANGLLIPLKFPSVRNLAGKQYLVSSVMSGATTGALWRAWLRPRVLPQTPLAREARPWKPHGEPELNEGGPSPQTRSPTVRRSKADEPRRSRIPTRLSIQRSPQASACGGSRTPPAQTRHSACPSLAFTSNGSARGEARCWHASALRRPQYFSKMSSNFPHFCSFLFESSLIVFAIVVQKLNPPVLVKNFRNFSKLDV